MMSHNAQRVRRFLQSGSWEIPVTAAGRLIANALAFALFWLLVRVLSPEEYAQLGLITGLQAFVQTIVLGPALVHIGRETWAWHQDRELTKRLGSLLPLLSVLCFLTNGILILIAFLVGWIGSDSLLGAGCGALLNSIWITVSSIMNTTGILRERRTYSLYLTIEGALKLLVVGVASQVLVRPSSSLCYVLVQGAGLVGASLAYLVTRDVLREYGLLVHSLWNTRHRLESGTIRFLFSSKPLRVAMLFDWILNTGNRYLLDPFVSRSVLGVFLAAWGLAGAALGAVESLFSSYMLPVLYQHTSGKDDTPQKRRDASATYLSSLLCLLIPLLAVFFAFADDLAAVLFKDYSGTPAAVLRWSLVFMAALVVSRTLQSLAMVQRELGPAAIPGAITSVIGLPILVLLTTQYGIEQGVQGLALVAAIGTAVMLLVIRNNVNWATVAAEIPMMGIGTALLLITGSGAFGLERAQAAEPDRWFLVLGWAVIGVVWAGFVWLGVRPRVSSISYDTSMPAEIGHGRIDM